MASALLRIKRRPEFLRVASVGKKWATPGLVIQAMKTSRNAELDASLDSEFVRIGFTVSRKVGNAVNRNRAKRRLRALCEQIMPEFASPGFDYVIIGRQATIKRPFEMLKQDLKNALNKTGTALGNMTK